MNINKYKLPNFFIKKLEKYRSHSSDYIYDGNIFYVDGFDDTVTVKFTISINFPGEKTLARNSSKVYSKETFNKIFYHINRLDNWKKYSVIETIFNKESAEVLRSINDI